MSYLAWSSSIFLWAAALPAADRDVSFSYWASLRAVSASIVGPIWASWSFLASISALFRAGQRGRLDLLGADADDGPGAELGLEGFEGHAGHRVVVVHRDGVEVLLEEGLLGRRRASLDDKNATKTPITISVLFLMSPPSWVIPGLLFRHDIFISRTKIKPFSARAGTGLPDRFFVLHYIAQIPDLGLEHGARERHRPQASEGPLGPPRRHPRRPGPGRAGLRRGRRPHRRSPEALRGGGPRGGHVLSLLLPHPPRRLDGLPERFHHLEDEGADGGGPGLRGGGRLPLRRGLRRRQGRALRDLLHRDERPGALGHRRRGRLHGPHPRQGQGHRPRPAGRDAGPGPGRRLRRRRQPVRARPGHGRQQHPEARARSFSAPTSRARPSARP